jgi:hypothetical protein
MKEQTFSHSDGVPLFPAQIVKKVDFFAQRDTSRNESCYQN